MKLTAGQCKDPKVRVMLSRLFELIKSPAAALSCCSLVNKMSWQKISLCDSFMLVIDMANLILAIFKTRKNMTVLPAWSKFNSD